MNHLVGFLQNGHFSASVSDDDEYVTDMIIRGWTPVYQELPDPTPEDDRPIVYLAQVTKLNSDGWVQSDGTDTVFVFTSAAEAGAWRDAGNYSGYSDPVYGYARRSVMAHLLDPDWKVQERIMINERHIREDMAKMKIAAYNDMYRPKVFNEPFTGLLKLTEA